MREKLSKNFNRDEFECQGDNCCNHSSPMDSRLIEALQKFRDKIGAPLEVLSGYRCNRHNASIVEAAPNSYHCKGMAADIKRPFLLTSAEFAAIAREFFKGGIGIYKDFIHVDVRKTGQVGWQG